MESVIWSDAERRLEICLSSNFMSCSNEQLMINNFQLNPDSILLPLASKWLRTSKDPVPTQKTVRHLQKSFILLHNENYVAFEIDPRLEDSF